MKLLTPAVLIVGTISAQDEDQNSSLAPSTRRLRDRQNMIDWLIEPKSDGPGRSVSDIKFYGCWCLPGAVREVPRGAPVDSLDAACKRAHQCYYCATKDNAEREKKCEARGTGYEFNLIGDENAFAGRSIECVDDPTDDELTNKEKKNGERQVNKYACRRQVCECDKKLAEDLLAAWSEYNPDFIHKNKDTADLGFEGASFELDASCSVENNDENTSLPRGELECCGPQYGVRMPFWNQFGLKACCGSMSYNTMVQACCDGVVVGGNTC